MIQSLRSRIFIVVTCIVLLSTVTIMFFIHKETAGAIFVAQDESTRNLIHTVLLTLENENNSIHFHEKTLMEERKKDLKNVMSVAFHILHFAMQEFETGRISEDQAKRMAVHEIQKIRYGDGVGYIWINDTGTPIPKMIMHPTIPELNGTILDAPRFNCALGIKKNLFQAFNEICADKGEGYVDYLWPKPTATGLSEDQPKLSFGKLFKEWNWILGTGVYIDDIERGVNKKKENILQELQEIFKKIKVADSGYMFVFNSKKEMLVHPSLVGADFSKMVNPVTGNLILDDLEKVALSDNKQLDYIWDKPPHYKGVYKFPKRSYVSYFKPLDWFVASSVYFDEKEKPARAMGNKILVLSFAILCIALMLAGMLSRSLTSPLSRLMITSQKINFKSMDSVQIPVSGTIETRELGNILQKMITSIRSAVKEKEHLFNELEETNTNLTEANLQLNREVAEREKAELKIKAALDEKEVLLREIHHRVKNNLAVIISLLSLQASHIPDERVKSALDNSRHRIKSMAMIHESLYQSKNLSNISLKDYIGNLVATLIDAMSGTSGRVEAVLDVEDIMVDIDYAVHCGLILNELVTNSLKYAFKEQGSGQIEIKARYNSDRDEIEIRLCDDGVGIGTDYDLENISTLGLKIVSLLIENQLDGRWSVQNDNGTCYEIYFPAGMTAT